MREDHPASWAARQRRSLQLCKAAAAAAELAYTHTLAYSGDDAAARPMEGLKPEAARSLAEKEKEFQKRLAKAKTHLPLAAILKGRRAAPQPKEQAKK